METREIDYFKKQMKSNIERVYTGGVALTHFLDEAKQQILLAMVLKDIEVLMDGGFANAEYKRVILRPFGSTFEDFKIIVFEIDYNKRYITLHHRSVLGALLSLGITREAVGDIVFKKERVYFSCTTDIAPFLLSHFKVIGHTPISLKEVKERLINEKEFIEKEVIVSSLRLDAILSQAYKLSRQASLDKVKDGEVKVNHISVLNPSQQLKENDVLSVEHKGRVYIRKIGGVTRSKRIVVTLGFLK